MYRVEYKVERIVPEYTNKAGKKVAAEKEIITFTGQLTTKEEAGQFYVDCKDMRWNMVKAYQEKIKASKPAASSAGPTGFDDDVSF